MRRKGREDKGGRKELKRYDTADEREKGKVRRMRWKGEIKENKVVISQLLRWA